MPATYRISVQGDLPESWSDRLGGMTIAVITEADQAPVTTLCGPLRDQAALLGVLNTLYDLHLPLLSVECMTYE
jgi:hypothetical protein